MIRILVCSHAAVLNVNRALFQELARQGGFDVRMLVPTHWKGDLIQDLRFERHPDDRELKIEALPVLFAGNGSLFVYSGSPRKTFQNWEPDILFVDEEPWSMACAQLFSTFPKAKKVFYTKQNLRKKIPAPFRLLEKINFSRSNSAFSVAGEVSDVLRDWKGYSRPVHRLPHSFDPVLFKKRSESERIQLKKKFGMPLDRVIVGYFGRLTEEKGIRDLLKAMQMDFASKGSRSHYLWVGNGPLQAEVQNAIQNTPGFATHLPAIPHQEVGEALSILDLLVLPSRTTPAWKEQFGRILTEAAAAGAALLGSDSGEIPRLINELAGGLVFREGDVPDLFEKIQVLTLNDEVRLTFASRGNKNAQEKFSHPAVTSILRKALENIALR